jgi:hypothetical protein
LQASEKMKKLNVEFASALSLSATLQLFAIGGLVEYGLWLAKYGLGEMSLCVCSGCSFKCGLVLTRTPSAASASSVRKRRQCISNPPASVLCREGKKKCNTIALRSPLHPSASDSRATGSSMIRFAWRSKCGDMPGGVEKGGRATMGA